MRLRLQHNARTHGCKRQSVCPWGGHGADYHRCQTTLLRAEAKCFLSYFLLIAFLVIDCSLPTLAIDKRTCELTIALDTLVGFA